MHVRLTCKSSADVLNENLILSVREESTFLLAISSSFAFNEDEDCSTDRNVEMYVGFPARGNCKCELIDSRNLQTRKIRV